MKYVIFDIETSGLPGKDGQVQDLQILEFAAVIEDTKNILPLNEVPKYKRIILHDQYVGGAFAINLNQRIFKILAERENYKKPEEIQAYDAQYGIISINELARDFFKFLFNHFTKLNKNEFFYGIINEGEAPLTIISAGKNFDNFDRKFIELIPKWNQYVRMRHRTIDPTSMYIDWEKDDVPPGLSDCLLRAGATGVVTHDALQDCLDTLFIIRRDYDIKKPWKK